MKLACPFSIAKIEKIVKPEDSAHLQGEFFYFSVAFFPELLYNIFRSFIRMWLSLVEHVLWEHGAAGSNPVIRTMREQGSLCSRIFIPDAKNALSMLPDDVPRVRYGFSEKSGAFHFELHHFYLFCL